MKKIGLISDTHGFIEQKVLNYFAECDEIWHAGDIGSIEVADKLAAVKPLRAVYGNIDEARIRTMFPEHQRFKCEDVDVWITHIGGYPGKYASHVRPELFSNPPRLFISGHSHILRVMYDKHLNLLHINPGAEGRYGVHKVRTIVRFIIDANDIKDLEVIELGQHIQTL